MPGLMRVMRDIEKVKYLSPEYIKVNLEAPVEVDFIDVTPWGYPRARLAVNVAIFCIAFLLGMR